MRTRSLLLFSMLLAGNSAVAKPCSMHASDFSVDGQPLTYDKARSMRGASVTGDTVHIGPIVLPNGMNGHIAIARDGCTRLESALHPHG